MRTALKAPLRNLVRALEILAWVSFVAFATVFLGLRYWLLPNIENYRGDIIAKVSRSIGLPVKIGAITTDWQGLRPRLSTVDVRVYDTSGREALVLPAVENVIGWRSLFVGELRSHSFVIDRPKLAVRRDASGEIYVAGIRISGGKGEDKVTDWILSQSEIVVRDAEIEWLDEKRKAPALRLSALNFRLQNDGDEHAAGLTARPPVELGTGLDVRARLEGESVRDFAQWSGRLFAELGYTDLAGWRHWLDYPVDVRRGEGALRLWATLAGGKLSQATADVALSNVWARLGRDLPPLEISEVRGRVFGSETVRGYEFGVRGLALARPQALAINSTSFQASYQPAGGTTLVPRGSLTANLIELGPLVQLAEFLPFPPDLRGLLAELSPQGNLLDAKFDWTGELPDRASFTARSRFSGLTMNAWRSIPGFANVSGSVLASETRGAVTFASRKSEIDLPKVFPEPRIALDALSGEVAWERIAAAGPGKVPGVGVRLSNLSFANEDLAGTAYGGYVWHDEGPGRADLTVQLSRADVKTTAKYLPLAGIMGERAREWGAGALLAGQLSDARMRLKGDLADFPFTDAGKGQFEVTARLSDAVFDYASGWPRMEGFEATLMFDREKFDLVGHKGSILGAKVENLRMSMPSVLAPDPQLIVEGGVEGPTAAFLEFIRESPVTRMTAGATEAMTSLGRGRLRLRLDLALQEMARSKVAGEYQFAGNSITLDPRLAPIERASGRLAFTEQSLAVRDLRGQMFGDQVRIAGGSNPDGSVQIGIEGRASVEGMRRMFDHPLVSPAVGIFALHRSVDREGGARADQPGLDAGGRVEFAAAAAGQERGRGAGAAHGNFSRRGPRPHLDRAGAAERPDRQRRVPARDSPGRHRAAGAARAHCAQPGRGRPIRIPERRGTTVRGSLPALDLDRWLPLLGEIADVPGGADGVSYDIKVGLLDALGKRMRGVSMQGAADTAGWSATMNTAEFAGDVVYRREGDGRLVARFTRLAVPEDAPGIKPGEAMRDLPAVDIVADEFTHRGRKVGRVEVLARHEGAAPRVWRIEKLAMTNPDSALTGSGVWRQGEASDTSLAFKLDVTDVGLFLDRFGFPNHVKSGKANLDGTLKWNGDPLTMDYATLNGQLKLHAEDGQFLEMEPGVGKLVSLMSLQMLPRRLSLDFRDVFSKGFHFDRINGDMGIERGVMTVQKFNMRGPAADVSMTGQLDLSLETQALMVRVTPQLGDTASTVVGLINPIAGLATLIAGRLIKNPLGKMFAFDYSINGTWADPEDRKAAGHGVGAGGRTGLAPALAQPERNTDRWMQMPCSPPPTPACWRRSTWRAASWRRYTARSPGAASTTRTCISSTRAPRAGAWRRARSNRAASRSNRASACAPSPARKPRSPTPTKSATRRCRMPRAQPVRLPLPAAAARERWRAGSAPPGAMNRSIRWRPWMRTGKYASSRSSKRCAARPMRASRR